jgi:hypothetical protein
MHRGPRPFGCVVQFQLFAWIVGCNSHNAVYLRVELRRTAKRFDGNAVLFDVRRAARKYFSQTNPRNRPRLFGLAPLK